MQERDQLGPAERHAAAGAASAQALESVRRTTRFGKRASWRDHAAVRG